MSSQFPEVRSFYNALLEAQNNTEVSASTEYKFWQAILPGVSKAIPSGSSRLRVSSGESSRAELISLLGSVHGDISREIDVLNELFDPALRENDTEQAVMHDTRIKDLTGNSTDSFDGLEKHTHQGSLEPEKGYDTQGRPLGTKSEYNTIGYVK